MALFIKMESDIHKRLKIATAESEDTMTAVVLQLIKEYLQKAEEKK